MFGAGVIVAMCLMGVLSQIIVYLTSRKLQNRLYAIAAIAQATFGMYRVSDRSNNKYARCRSEGDSSWERRSRPIRTDL
jgi:sulfite exporter TauE/SafE